jgi:hypothetical protein
LVVKRTTFSLLLLFVLVSTASARAETLSDPLRPLIGAPTTGNASQAPAAEKTNEWRLGSVLTSAQRSVAVINGRALQVGDMLEGYELVKIEPTKVLLKKKDKQLVLRRSGTGLKAAAPNPAAKGSQP